MSTSVQSLYGNRLRVRACGLLVRNDSLLMVNHRMLTNTDFWSPPGGGVQFGESVPDALQREVLEETGLRIEVGELLFTTEFIKDPLHAVELFFRIAETGGALRKGTDPETGPRDQIIKDVAFLPWTTIQKFAPQTLHGVFRFVDEPAQITGLRGFFRV